MFNTRYVALISLLNISKKDFRMIFESSLLSFLVEFCRANARDDSNFPSKKSNREIGETVATIGVLKLGQRAEG